MYEKDSLELLRQRIDLVAVVEPYVQLQKSGAAYKACCPFHNEKTPSFVIQKGERHYHCFGCGAHGDAVAFMMSYVKLSFKEAIETLAEKFQVHLEKEERPYEKRGPSKIVLKEATELACQFFAFSLLHTEEGHAALQYLYGRGLSLEFIQKFRIGFAPKDSLLLHKVLQAQGVLDATMESVGLLSHSQGGRVRGFFFDRITFPICDGLGAVIGFSARKYKEDTFGGKYINTPETPLFKKSQVLYGLSYSRPRIAKERKAVVVEGQIDALRLIDAGFDYAVAGQGTAFGEGHVRELLQLGVQHAFLALDGDTAGGAAAVKIGNLFQKKGVEVTVALLPEGSDPDTLLRDQGSEAFQNLLDTGTQYLPFLFHRMSQGIDLKSPSMKNSLVQEIAAQVRTWEEPLMVHESLRKLAEISRVPEDILGVGVLPEVFVRRSGKVDFHQVDPDQILETDLLRWLLLFGESQPRIVEIVRRNLEERHFKTPTCAKLFTTYLRDPRDLLSLAADAEDPEVQQMLSGIMRKKVNAEKWEEYLLETVKKLLVREWMAEREAIKAQLQSGACSDEEALELAKTFDTLRKNTPTINST